MSSKNKRAANEIYCTSCGEVIKEKAEICPECGVANENKRTPSSISGSTSQPTTHDSDSQSFHDPSNHETTVSESWWYGVVSSIILWIIGFALLGGSAIAGLVTLSAWVLMPLSIYYDRQWVQATTNWKPDLNIWLIITLIPLFNIAAGSVYLFNRYDAKKVTSAATKTDSDHVSKGTTVDEVHQQYVNDELSEEEFETELEEAVRNQETSNMERGIKSK